MTAPSTPPTPPTWEEVARAAAAATTAAVIEVLRALREELERLLRAGEAAAGRVQGALVRSVHALQRALVASILALLFLALGGVVLAVFMVAALNRVLGDPWGTGVAAAALLVVAGLLMLRARAQFAAMRREAEALTRGPR